MSVRSEWHGEQVSHSVRKSVAAGLLSGAEAVKARSVAVAPTETLELRASAYADVDESSQIAIVGYDVARDVKSIKQHEDLGYAHKPGEQSKFLEKPLRESRGEVQSLIRNAVGGALR